MTLEYGSCPNACAARTAVTAVIDSSGVHCRQCRDGAVLGAPHYFVYPTLYMYLVAIGWPVFIAGLVGLSVLGWRLPRAGLSLLAFPLIYFATASQGNTVLFRYMLPVVPFLCLGAAFLVSIAAGRLRDGRATAVVSIAAVVALAAPSAIAVVRVDRLLARSDSRLIVRACPEFDVYSRRTN
jgi:hypothetical protein